MIAFSTGHATSLWIDYGAPAQAGIPGGAIGANALLASPRSSPYDPRPFARAQIQEGLAGSCSRGPAR
ncbi:hypothetical protein HDIA_1517 [Hartmannibacter diazotrophicus]|uniref:Uncharacterized protein n=1 Tax=Hartmannibacter diazotrophicus TaxID=1482074 RepID=A0A2C9D4H1_9HYPH|nr:hypothetical protein HDIA_1517 [Hartmannibacter diazotrophicus]